MCHNWYYHIYESYDNKKIVFVYIFHTRVKPFFPLIKFSISRRYKIDLTSNSIKDSARVFNKRNNIKRKLYCNLLEMHPCFINEVNKRSCYLHTKYHTPQFINEEILFEYDNYVIFMYACPLVATSGSSKKLVVIEEDGSSPRRYRRHGLVKIYTTDLSFLRI